MAHGVQDVAAMDGAGAGSRDALLYQYHIPEGEQDAHLARFEEALGFLVGEYGFRADTRWRRGPRRVDDDPEMRYWRGRVRVRVDLVTPRGPIEISVDVHRSLVLHQKGPPLWALQRAMGWRGALTAGEAERLGEEGARRAFLERSVAFLRNEGRAVLEGDGRPVRAAERVAQAVRFGEVSLLEDVICEWCGGELERDGGGWCGVCGRTRLKERRWQARWHEFIGLAPLWVCGGIWCVAGARTAMAAALGLLRPGEGAWAAGVVAGAAVVTGVAGYGVWRRKVWGRALQPVRSVLVVGPAVVAVPGVFALMEFGGRVSRALF